MAAGAIERKLAAIMIADVAGFSRLMERDESRTFERLTKLREVVTNATVSEHGGRIIKTTGDGFLAEFPSATAAVKCGVQIQRTITSLEADLDQEDRIRFRIGIHVGDVIIDGSDVAGDGVNIAARLESIAPLDGLCVSSSVREQIRDDLGIAFLDLGEQQLKNIARPIRAFAVTVGDRPRSRLKHILVAAREYLTHWVIAGTIIALTGFAPDPWLATLLGHSEFLESLRHKGLAGFDLRIVLVAAGVAIVVWDMLRRTRVQKHAALADSRAAIPSPAPLPKRNGSDEKHIEATDATALTPSVKPSIAVLPFNNMSGDPEQDYFADGMVEEVITGLSRIKWLSVISRNSSFIYKNRPVVVKEVADKLGVRYVIEGSVRKSRNRVRITAQLIDAGTGAHLWAEQYDRLLEDVFALQDEITTCVVGAIEPSLRKAEIDRIKRQRPNNLDAYDFVLRSLPFVFTNMPREAEKAIPLLEDALKLEPNYAAAHAFLSWCHHARFSRGGLLEKDRIAAIEHAHAAITQGNDDATALAVAAFVIALEEHDTTTALKLFDRALEFSNSNIFALSCSAMTLALLGTTELAIERAQQSLRLSPFDSYNFRSNNALAVAYFHTQRYASAEAAARTAIDANPGFSFTHAVLSATLMRLGRVEEAKATAKTVLQCEPSFTIGGLLRIVGLEPAVYGPLAEAWREAGLPA